MAETQSKRLREESHERSSSEFDDSTTNSKRQKPYSNILNLLDEEEEEGEGEPNHEPSHELSQDLSAIFTTLQQELSSSTSCDSTTTTFDFDSLPCTAAVEAELSHHHHHQATTASATSAECGGADEDEGVKSVMRHLLEASDDELGIPNRGDDDNIAEISSGENFAFGFTDHGLWDLEDEAANYYTVLQSELFM